MQKLVRHLLRATGSNRRPTVDLPAELDRIFWPEYPWKGGREGLPSPAAAALTARQDAEPREQGAGCMAREAVLSPFELYSAGLSAQTCTAHWCDLPEEGLPCSSPCRASRRPASAASLREAPLLHEAAPVTWGTCEPGWPQALCALLRKGGQAQGLVDKPASLLLSASGRVFLGL